MFIELYTQYSSIETEAEDFQKMCHLDDYYQIESISSAIRTIDTSEHSFEYFDQGFSERDYGVLHEIKIKDFSTITIFGEMHTLQTKVENFLKSSLTEDTNAIYLSILITKLATQIISVSQYSDAIVSLIAYNNGLEPNSPYWHIDKTHEEEVELKQDQDEYNKQYVFLSTLKGNSTLYYPVDYAARTTLSASIQESAHSYYWTNEIFNKSLVSFAKFGQGSVHLAGYKYGAIHGTPDGKERLLMITTPSNSNTIKKLKERA